MKIISTCKMGHGTFEAKFRPLELISNVKELKVLRKASLDGYEKLNFIILPKYTKYKILNLLFCPIILTREAKKMGADFIIAYHFIPHAFFAYFASLLTRKPFIIGQTGIYIQRYAQKPFIGKIVKHVVKKALYLNVPGQISKEFWLKNGFPDSKINILHSTIDVDYYTPLNINKEYDFIYVGRIAPEKQLHLIIKALSNLHHINIKATLVIVGTGRKRRKNEKLVRKYHLNDFVYFAGFQEDVKLWLNKSSIFVMSSESEGLPTALMQAMACELICISSNVGNISDMIFHKKNGYLFKKDNIEELTSLMKTAIQNRHQNHDIRKEARKEIEKNHSYQSAKKKWESILEVFKINQSTTINKG